MPSKVLQISEIFISIQGESTYAGLPCFFIRTAGCNLDCFYCDTGYARANGLGVAAEEIVHKVKLWPGNLVEITGGEPLLQEDLPWLCEELLKLDKTVLIETNGSLDIEKIPAGVIRIMDIKCPDSGMSNFIYWPNLEKLNAQDEVKFVLSSRKDYDWARYLIIEKKLAQKAKIIFSSARNRLSPAQLAEWMIADKVTDVRLQIQLHKYIWPDRDRGV